MFSPTAVHHPPLSYSDLCVTELGAGDACEHMLEIVAPSGAIERSHQGCLTRTISHLETLRFPCNKTNNGRMAALTFIKR